MYTNKEQNKVQQEINKYSTFINYNHITYKLTKLFKKTNMKISHKTNKNVLVFYKIKPKTIEEDNKLEIPVYKIKLGLPEYNYRTNDFIKLYRKKNHIVCLHYIRQTKKNHRRTTQ